MKTGKLFWGLGLILLAVFLLLDTLGILSPLESVVGEISLFRAILGVGLLSIIISSLLKLRLEGIFVPAALFFMLFENNISILCGSETPDLISNWSLLIIAVLMTIGFGILRSSFKLCVRIDGSKKHGGKGGGNLGHSSVYINGEDFTSYDVKNNLGSCEVHFENPEMYTGGGVLHINNHLGYMEVNVPSSWHAEVNVDNSLGSITEPSEFDPEAPTVLIRGENNLGVLEIKYV